MGDDRATSDARDLERRWASIRGRMEAASDILARRGSIASRLTPAGTRVCSLRYPEPGRGRQRAVYLGPEGSELVRRARALLGRYREEDRRAREIEEVARFMGASSALLRRVLAKRHRRPARPPGS